MEKSTRIYNKEVRLSTKMTDKEWKEARKRGEKDYNAFIEWAKRAISKSFHG